MSQSYVIAVEGLESLKSLDNLDPEILKAAQIAVNFAAREGRKLSADKMRSQVNFPARYLTGENSRLKVTKFASANDLVATITGRRRPTSLARFSNGVVGRKGPVSVEVKPGSARTLQRAFLMKLKSGTAAIDEAFNVGLAVRTKDGTKPEAAYKPKKIGENLWLLYGPSVDQVFKTVRDEVSPDVLTAMEDEFQRQIGLRS